MVKSKKIRTKKSNYEIIGKVNGKVQAKRKDGLMVFLDGKDDKALDNIRLECPDKRVVILAVAIRRCQQIATGYARKYAPEVAKEIERTVKGFVWWKNNIKHLKGKEVR